MPGGSPRGRGSAKLSATVIAGRDQSFGKKYFLMLSPSVLKGLVVQVQNPDFAGILDPSGNPMCTGFVSGRQAGQLSSQ